MARKVHIHAVLAGQSLGEPQALLFAAHDPEQFGAAIGADALHGWTAILHGDLLRFGHFLLRFTLYTIGFSHGIHLLWNTSTVSGKLGRILVADPSGVKGQN